MNQKLTTMDPINEGNIIENILLKDDKARNLKKTHPLRYQKMNKTDICYFIILISIFYMK